MHQYMHISAYIYTCICAYVYTCMGMREKMFVCMLHVWMYAGASTKMKANLDNIKDVKAVLGRLEDWRNRVVEQYNLLDWQTKKELVKTCR